MVQENGARRCAIVCRNRGFERTDYGREGVEGKEREKYGGMGGLAAVAGHETSSPRRVLHQPRADMDEEAKGQET